MPEGLKVIFLFTRVSFRTHVSSIGLGAQSVQDPFPSCHSKVERNLPRYMTPSQFPTVPGVACRLCPPAFISTNGIQLETASQPTQEPIRHLLGDRQFVLVAETARFRFQHSGEWGVFKTQYTWSRNHLFFFHLFPLDTVSASSFKIFRGLFLSSRPFKSWGQGKLFGIVHGDVHQWHTIWVPPKHSVVPETWLTQEDHMAMVALLHWNCNKSLQNLLLLP